MNCLSQVKVWGSEHLAAEVREEEMQVGFSLIRKSCLIMLVLLPVKYCDICQDGELC